MTKLIKILQEIKPQIGRPWIIYENNLGIIKNSIKDWKNQGFKIDDEDEDGNDIIDYIYEDLNFNSDDFEFNNDIEEEQFSNILKSNIKKLYNQV